MKRKILIFFCILFIINFIGCNFQTKKQSEVKNEGTKEATNVLSETERYYYILNTKETYSDLEKQSDGLNCIFMNKLIDGEVEYDSRYKARVEELKDQRDNNEKNTNEKFNEESSENNNIYKDVKISDNIVQSIQEVNEKILKDLDNSKVFKKYNVKMAQDSVIINLGSNININDMNKDALSNTAKNIFTYFKDSGLANSKEGAVPLHIYFIINNKKFESSWSLDKEQIDSWNN